MIKKFKNIIIYSNIFVFLTINSSFSAIFVRYGLIDAVKDNNLAEVREYLIKDYDPNAYDRYHNTALSYAIRNQNYRITKLLLYYGANPEMLDSTLLPIYCAAFAKNDEKIQKIFSGTYSLEYCKTPHIERDENGEPITDIEDYTLFDDEIKEENSIFRILSLIALAVGVVYVAGTRKERTVENQKNNNSRQIQSNSYTNTTSNNKLLALSGNNNYTINLNTEINKINAITTTSNKYLKHLNDNFIYNINVKDQFQPFNTIKNLFAFSQIDYNYISTNTHKDISLSSTHNSYYSIGINYIFNQYNKQTNSISFAISKPIILNNTITHIHHQNHKIDFTNKNDTSFQILYSHFLDNTYSFSISNTYTQSITNEYLFRLNYNIYF